ncbi:putative GTPase activating protein [Nitzschia inconspicua]|uniref:GTPase activating protein n=1 Tax=Nitzschia inconspicua TaxID=303405 RepID=A0A9K3M5B9_9STRA|nr:putative GTPase activating protein [Nitzschia inconspicua]
MSSFHSHGGTSFSGEEDSNHVVARTRLRALTDSTCADCSSTRPSWASLLKTPQIAGQVPNNVSTIAAFVCYHCAAHHRSLGTHICRVKSCTLDDWNDKELWAADVGGNQRVNAIFEALLNATDNKPTQHSTSDERINFIRDKYVNHKYLDVANYKLCRAKRTQSVGLEEDESIISGSFSAIRSPTASQSSRRSLSSLSTPQIIKPSFFFTPTSTAKQDEEEEEDMFADSATTTSDLFGFGRSSPTKRRSSSFDGEIIDEGEEDDDSDQDEDDSEIPYPKLAQSVSNFSAFEMSSDFCPKGNPINRPTPLRKKADAPMMHSSSGEMENLRRQKEEALESEDYMKAAQIKRQMAALLNPSSNAEIESLESLKKLAVRQEDYIRAAELKARIEELRNQRRTSRQLLVESSLNSAIESPMMKSQKTQRDSLDHFFGRNQSEEMNATQETIQNGRVVADEADDIEEGSFLIHGIENNLINNFKNQPEDASHRFSRSIAEASQHSKLDTLGFVVDKTDSKDDKKDFTTSSPKYSDSSSSRRTRRAPVRDPIRDGSGIKKSRSRSRTKREKLRRTSSSSNSNVNEKKQDGRTNDDPQRRYGSSNKGKISIRSGEQRHRSKIRERSNSRERKENGKDRKSRGRSKSQDRKTHHKEKQDRERSKSQDRKSSQKNIRERSYSNERRSDKDRQARNRSKSRDRKSTEKNSRTGRASKVATENSVSRNRSKSRSNRDLRRKSQLNKPIDNQEVRRSTSFVYPANGIPFSSPKSKQFSTSIPTCSMYSPTGSQGNRDSSFRRKMMEATGIDKPIHNTSNTTDDISVDESFKTFASETVQSAHQRGSTGRVSMSRRNLESDSPSYDVSPKGSHSLHLNRRALTDSFGFGETSQKENFFATKLPFASPSTSTVSGGPGKRLSTAGFETPSAEQFSKRQLKIGSPAGVEDFPQIATPNSLSRKESLTEKYKQEVERTVNRLERLRELKRHRVGVITK